ncbi:glucan endo-1,3-beta-glucosidase 7 [Brachypodium distachyon]|uniref:X8 domain-containing protein n=1 Tax=Brachypodium distachyon TaxID=15368 RepID=I1GTQ8_BRADI|nr:glucan endo-1,3-beta-glucosidase 7 [Brachypodium distachyon]KQK15883.1 hypothetical protein BRADI_1g25530v3 [Brachypodium distachyon]|eukprot:XP_003562973.1 glucan endo-1,3-beta-glucosidase 7 [Brachypodium distachyon]
MALTCLLIVLLCVSLSLLFVNHAEAGEVGVSYGRIGNNLMDPASVVQLLNQNGITSIRVYDTDEAVLNSMANTGIKILVGLPNELVASAADDPSYALRWVQDNVKRHYPDAKINGVTVGNEVFNQASQLTSKLVPAMKNVQAALARLGLADAIKVTTPIALNALKQSSPPSQGAFRDDIAQSVMSPMLDFLDQTGSYLMVNIYPYYTYKDQQGDFSLAYATSGQNDGVLDSGTGVRYYSLFDAQLAAVHYANRRRGHPRVHVVVGETGWCSYCNNAVASKENAASYVNNVIRSTHSSSGGSAGTMGSNRTLAVGAAGAGTNGDFSVYIFALFNENQKPADEQNFGLFYPNGQAVYQVDFRGGGGGGGGGGTASWCVARSDVGDARLQAALDYACGHGADCSAIQPGKACYEPNTKAAHASYAFNDYYQSKGRASGTCDFAGAASVVYQQPSGTCDPKAASWCVANAAVGDARLQAALDYACGHGADCGAIQPGAQCFDPNTKVAHASYAMNDYYQRNGRTARSCDFGGAGSVVHQAPNTGNCVLPSRA